MTDAEKAAAFDLIAASFAREWTPGRWSWWPGNPAGGPDRATKEEAVADLIEWCRRDVARKGKR